MRPTPPPLPDPARLLPLKPVVFEVLLSLLDGERHGYGVVGDIAQRSGGGIRLEPGNLYRTLRGMLDLDLIAESDRRPAPDLDDQRRRYYRITAFGERVAAAEAARLRSLLRQAGVLGLLDRRPISDPEVD
jgi:DNA-binding PadR family transcriptional regulator